MVLPDDYYENRDFYERRSLERKQRREAEIFLRRELEQCFLIAAELLEPKSDQPLVSPDRIPISPYVFTDPLFYDEDFVKRVLHEWGTEVEEDARALKNRYGIGIKVPGFQDALTANIDPKRRMVNFGYGGANLLITPEGVNVRYMTRREELPETFSDPKIPYFSTEKNSIHVPGSAFRPDKARDVFPAEILLPLRAAAKRFNNYGVIALAEGLARPGGKSLDWEFDGGNHWDDWY